MFWGANFDRAARLAFLARRPLGVRRYRASRSYLCRNSSPVLDLSLWNERAAALDAF